MERAFAPYHRRTRPLLLLFLAGSTMLHAAALIVLPGFLPAREVPRFTILEVVLVQAAAMQPQPGRDQAAIAPSVPPRQSESHTPVLALPEPSAVAGGAPSAPLAEESSSRQGEPTETANVALTPPSFSARYLRNPPPHYPPAARHAGEQGTVTLRVLVTRAGLASRVTVERSSGSPHLDAAALEAVKVWHFAPARQGTDPVESWWVVPIVFRLEGAS